MKRRGHLTCLHSWSTGTRIRKERQEASSLCLKRNPLFSFLRFFFVFHLSFAWPFVSVERERRNLNDNVLYLSHSMDQEEEKEEKEH
ncbi:hypothetical protein CSUI_009347, partial [Cystoisospora suis]